jgi:SOS-response transcriptional repressor LexA
MKITKKRQLVLDFIKAYIKVHGMAPSYEAIAKGIGLNAKSNAYRIVKRLEADGYLQTKPRKFYGIKVFDRSVKEIASL